MKNKLILGVGIATGYVLGSRSGRAAYDKLKARAAAIWDSKPVQDKVSVATEAFKEKAPDVADQLTEAARRASTVIGSAMHRDSASGAGTSATSDTAAASGTSAGTAETPATTTGVSGTPGTPEVSGLDSGHIPAHSTHPETLNLDTSSGETESKPS